MRGLVQSRLAESSQAQEPQIQRMIHSLIQSI